MNYVISWFYAENTEDESYYPQVGGKSTSNKFQNIYWKCIYNFYYSSLIYNKCEHIFFTNLNKLPRSIDGIDIENFF